MKTVMMIVALVKIRCGKLSEGEPKQGGQEKNYILQLNNLRPMLFKLLLDKQS